MVKDLIQQEAWPFGVVFVVEVEMEMVEVSIVHCIWVSLSSVSQIAAQRVRNLHHLGHIEGLK